MQEQRHPLGDLIREQMSLNGWSLDAVVRRAVSRGEKLGKSNLDAVIKNPPKQLSRATLFGLAAGIGVTPQTVASAALASMGVTTRPEFTDAESAIRTDPSLTEHDRRILTGLIGVLREQERDRHDRSAVSASPSSSSAGTPDPAGQSKEAPPEGPDRWPDGQPVYDEDWEQWKAWRAAGEPEDWELYRSGKQSDVEAVGGPGSYRIVPGPTDKERFNAAQDADAEAPDAETTDGEA